MFMVSLTTTPVLTVMLVGEVPVTDDPSAAVKPPFNYAVAMQKSL
jgi:hypothetical protein